VLILPAVEDLTNNIPFDSYSENSSSIPSKLNQIQFQDFIRIWNEYLLLEL